MPVRRLDVGGVHLSDGVLEDLLLANASVQSHGHSVVKHILRWAVRYSLGKLIVVR